MSDVAKLAGVSNTTVSHVINRTRPVSTATEQAVLAAAAEVGYVPDNVTRSMRMTGARTIGLAMSAMTNTYFGEVVHNIEMTVSRAGYSLLLADTHDDPPTELRAVASLLSRRVDGLVLAPSADPSRALEHAASQDVPVVLIDRSAPYEVDQVACQSLQPTAELVDHLAEIGHQRIAMISGKPGLATTTERVDGYRLGMRRNNLQIDESLLVSGNSTDEGAARAFEQLWAMPARPTALVVANNNMTIGAVGAAQRSGVEIPRDVALVGFDDFPWAAYFRPGLTVMGQPTDSVGEQAAELLLSRLRNPDLPARKVMLNPWFAHRESCGCGQSPQDRKTPGVAASR